jgi:hypothetical protein
MHRLTGTGRWSRLGVAGLAIALAIGAWAALPSPAAARVFVGIGGPFPGYYAPYPYYYPPPAYYPYYPPPPAYYPPPAQAAAPAYYPPPAQAAAPAYYPPPAQAEAPAYYPPPAQAAAPAYYSPPAQAEAPAASPTSSAAITYTERPAFKNATGQTCREYRAANGALGSACQDSSGQWRVAN